MAGTEYTGLARSDRELRLRLRLRGGPPLLLDGATGTELERRGVRCELPLWSAHALIEAPRCVARIHGEYCEAGADILTANTFRTQRRTLARGGVGERAAELTQRAISLAREAASASSHPPLVAGSAPTLEDCYRPDRVPEAPALEQEHRDHAQNLLAGGADLILVETMNTIREARAAADAAARTGLPFLVSFVSWEKDRLLSGEALSDALVAVAEFRPLAVLANCLPPSAVGACLESLRNSGLPFGVYANLGAPDDRDSSTRSEDCTPEEFAAHAAGWLQAGAAIIGGCCGTSPAHIRALHRLVAR